MLHDNFRTLSVVAILLLSSCLCVALLQKPACSCPPSCKCHAAPARPHPKPLPPRVDPGDIGELAPAHTA